MRLETKKYLYDIIEAAELLREFTKGRTFPQYSNDPMLRAAVEREFEIIGEAVTQLAKIDSATAQRIPEYRRIIAFRNLLIHRYAAIDHRIVWDVLTLNLPALLEQAQQLMKEP